MINDGSEMRWLRKAGDEWQWAQKYISKHADAAMRGGIRNATQTMKEGYEQVAAAITYLEQSAEGLKLVSRLKSALRQHRYRSPSHGRKPCTFSLPNSTRANLSRRAKDNKITETEAIITLIDDAERAVRTHSERAKTLKATLAFERKRSEVAIELLRTQLEEITRHLERSTELLVMWEQTMECEQPPFSGDMESVKREVEMRLKYVKTVNTMAALSNDLPNRETELQ